MKAKRLLVFENSNGVCCYCKCPITLFNFTLEHVTPKSKGGSNHVSNLAAACRRCNQRKGDMSAQEFVRKNKKYFALRRAEYRWSENPEEKRKAVRLYEDMFLRWLKAKRDYPWYPNHPAPVPPMVLNHDEALEVRRRTAADFKRSAQ